METVEKCARLGANRHVNGARRQKNAATRPGRRLRDEPHPFRRPGAPADGKIDPRRAISLLSRPPLTTLFFPFAARGQ
jgi:hypothetical protein